VTGQVLGYRLRAIPGPSGAVSLDPEMPSLAGFLAAPSPAMRARLVFRICPPFDGSEPVRPSGGRYSGASPSELPLRGPYTGPWAITGTKPLAGAGEDWGQRQLGRHLHYGTR
jgi:hypothetical protein